MTKKETNNEAVNDIILEDYYKLSIQVSLNGLSFCILDSIGKKIIRSESYRFRYKLNPYEAQKELTAFIKTQGITEYSFSEVVAVHRNDLFSLVPKVLFNPKELPNYLKYNAKILANDLLEYDEMTAFDLVNVYVPFVNINNDIYDLFGDFEFKHHGTVLIETLLAGNNTGNDPICYAYVTPEELDLIIIQNKKLIFFNNFTYNTPEDFLYYLMFSIEQLQFDINDIKLRVFGAIEEGDGLYELCQDYVQHLSIYIPDLPDGLFYEGLNPADNYLVINAF
ncbi:DUF3822 family protein [Muriicola soli]|uniref:DUF3822 family protein n=1 Tax=Muriicola soli TaxID=2507538 RepID=A0A411E7V0_9FLAO|nr:DUF3822 family protein [Muriicola soli]QBA63786.1 DUF3822 family protein [Muriicola soli]